MRILSEATLVKTLKRYMIEDGLRGNIVFRNAERRREFYRDFTNYVISDEFDVYRQGNVITFRNHSLIRLTISANRPTSMFDDILIDQAIDDFELLFSLCRHERIKELENYEGFFEEPIDLGEIDSSPELLDYIGGLNGNR
jgi:hypothetical protein